MLANEEKLYTKTQLKKLKKKKKKRQEIGNEVWLIHENKNKMRLGKKSEKEKPVNPQKAKTLKWWYPQARECVIQHFPKV